VNISFITNARVSCFDMAQDVSKYSINRIEPSSDASGAIYGTHKKHGTGLADSNAFELLTNIKARLLTISIWWSPERAFSEG
jgi:hypothetical protein